MLVYNGVLILERIQQKNIFRGFSTFDRTKPFTELSDIELVKRDLLNHFNTIPNERVMRPNFGCRIWDFLFEPFTESVREAIIDEVESILEFDTRVELRTIEVTEFDHGIMLECILFYRGLDVVNTFSVEFDRRNTSSDIEADSF